MEWRNICIFEIRGKRQFITDVLNKFVSGDVSTSTESVVILGGIESNPADFFGFNSRISFLICDSFI